MSDDRVASAISELIKDFGTSISVFESSSKITVDHWTGDGQHCKRYNGDCLLEVLEKAADGYRTLKSNW